MRNQMTSNLIVWVLLFLLRIVQRLDAGNYAWGSATELISWATAVKKVFFVNTVPSFSSGYSYVLRSRPCWGGFIGVCWVHKGRGLLGARSSKRTAPEH